MGGIGFSKSRVEADLLPVLKVKDLHKKNARGVARGEAEA